MTRIYELLAHSDIWTGDLQGKPGRLITTGLLGSIRWWFEVLVRGFGGEPCDPSNSQCIDREHCVVCELFGCTGWARKFRFDVLGADNTPQQKQIQKSDGDGDTYKLRFTPLRHICDEEWALLALTLRFIADYGAIGGKTVFKPTDEDHRQKEPHHQDFGLIQLIEPILTNYERKPLESYMKCFLVCDSANRSWASIDHFWQVRGHYLTRQSAEESNYNYVLHREQSKRCRDCKSIHDPPTKCPRATKNPKTGKIPASKRLSERMVINVTRADEWLAGDQRVSKKIFSFKSSPRTFGFINPSNGDDRVTLDDIKNRLGAAWQRTVVEEEVAEGDTTKIQLLTGSEILDRLLRAQEATS